IGSLGLWCCNTGQDECGSDFVQALARATGAEIAAAPGLVGSPALGGNWLLDGTTDIQPPLTPHGVAQYAGVMAVKKASLTTITNDSGTVGDFITNDTTLILNGTDTDNSISTLGVWIAGGTYGTGNGG